jgi:hypothetical protein
MRVQLLTAGLLLTSAIISTSLATLPASAHQARVTCLCDCPDDHKVQRHSDARPVMPAPRKAVRRMVRRPMHRYAEGGYYSYSSAAPIIQREWHGEWRQAPNDAYIPGPRPMAYYAPPPPYQGLQIDNRGWTGGVGGGEGGGGGGGGDGGFGQVHFGNGGSVENGPTYNSYNQSFPFNPSQAGPFQPRLMGGIAPAAPAK